MSVQSWGFVYGYATHGNYLILSAAERTGVTQEWPSSSFTLRISQRSVTPDQRTR